MTEGKHTPVALPKITAAQWKWLRAADIRGTTIITCHEPSGFVQASFNKVMRGLLKSGIVREYVHGGYEITELGRAAIAKATGAA